MEKELKDWIEETREKANSKADFCEPWKHYFDLRANEIEILFSLFDLKSQDMVLEIGCGNGFNSCILSKKARKVIATDLFKEDIKTHSQGMRIAKRLIGALDIINCDTLSCSGESLPFKDRTFDIVFSMYTLEHIADKKKVLADVARVLKEGGIFIFIVPNFVERLLYYPLPFYKDMPLALFRRIFSKKRGFHAAIENITGGNSARKEPLLKRLRTNYPHFPLPEPHGSYKNYFEEVVSYLPGNWKRLLSDSGLEIVDHFSSMVLPKSLFNLFFGALSLPLYKRLSWIDKRIGRSPVMRNFGQNICFVLKRR